MALTFYSSTKSFTIPIGSLSSLCAPAIIDTLGPTLTKFITRFLGHSIYAGDLQSVPSKATVQAKACYKPQLPILVIHV